MTMRVACPGAGRACSIAALEWRGHGETSVLSRRLAAQATSQTQITRWHMIAACSVTMAEAGGTHTAQAQRGAFPPPSAELQHLLSLAIRDEDELPSLRGRRFHAQNVELRLHRKKGPANQYAESPALSGLGESNPGREKPPSCNCAPPLVASKGKLATTRAPPALSSARAPAARQDKPVPRRRRDGIGAAGGASRGRDRLPTAIYLPLRYVRCAYDVTGSQDRISLVARIHHDVITARKTPQTKPLAQRHNTL